MFARYLGEGGWLPLKKINNAYSNKRKQKNNTAKPENTTVDKNNSAQLNTTLYNTAKQQNSTTQQHIQSQTERNKTQRNMIIWVISFTAIVHAHYLHSPRR